MNVQAANFPRRLDRVAALASWRADIPHQHAASALALCIDAVVVVAISMGSGLAFQEVAHNHGADLAELAGIGAIVAAFFCGLVQLQSSRDPRASVTRLGRARIAAVSWIVTFLFLIVLAFTIKISAHFSRGGIFLFFVTGLAGAVASRTVVPRLLARWLQNNTYRGLEVLIVAPRDCAGAEAVAGELGAQGCKAIRRLAFDDRCGPVAWIQERKHLLQRVFDAARSAAPGEIYVLGGGLSFEAISGLMSGLRVLPRAIYLVPDEQVSTLLQHAVRGLGGVLATEMQKSPLTGTERAVKRATDIAIAAMALAFLAPLLLAIGIAIAVDSRGPLLFRQQRLGYRGRPFQIVKFRTMTVMEDGAEIPQAQRNDQRMTPVGRWLRRSSLDELPQLWNVLRGEMSIVGPRPHAAAHDALYARLIENYEVRQHVKPGITGWAQVHGLRGATPNIDLMYRRIEMDIWYACNCSLELDAQVLFKTVGAVLGQENAF